MRNQKYSGPDTRTRINKAIRAPELRVVGPEHARGPHRPQDGVAAAAPGLALPEEREVVRRIDRAGVSCVERRLHVRVPAFDKLAPA